MVALAAPRLAAAAPPGGSGGGAAGAGQARSLWQHDEKQQDTRRQNICAAKAVSDAIRTSLGPRGMDKMVQDSKGGVLITNDGATILEQISVMHPVAKMMVELSRAQDMEAGDGTTSVVVFCGALLDAAQQLLDKGIHPQTIATAFLEAASQAETILRAIAVPVDLGDRESLIETAATALQSKVVSQNAALLAPIACDAVLEVMRRTTPGEAPQIRLQDIRVVKKLGGTVEDCELVRGVVLIQQKVARRANGPNRVQGAKIGLIQFCLSAPKTDMENNIVISDYTQMDRMLREERTLIARMVKQIAATGCNCLLIQKSILRDAVNDLSLDYLAKAKILVIRDIERDDIEFLSKTLGCSPVASLDRFTTDCLGKAELVQDELVSGGGRIVRITGVPSRSAITVLLRASNNLVLDEAERSVHDALCVVRCLIRKQFLLPGGGAPEAELALRLHEWARGLPGVSQICAKKFADAMEIVPYTLAENAGLQPLEIVTQLRQQHAAGRTSCGIDLRHGSVADMRERKVLQPLLVTLSAIQLATEAVAMILKIDDIVLCR